MNTPQKGCSFPKFPKFTLELPFLLQLAPKASLLLWVVSNVESFFHLFPRSKHNVHTILLYATRLCFLCLLDSANKDVSCTSSMVVHFLIVWHLSRGVSFLFLTSFLFFFGDVKTGFSLVITDWFIKASATKDSPSSFNSWGTYALCPMH